MTSDTLLTRLQLPPFEPIFWAKKGLQQTIAAYYYPYNPFLPKGSFHAIPLPDKDQILISINPPKKKNPSPRMILLVHGLSGSYISKYMIRFTRQLTQLGFTVARMNLRGSGPGKTLASKLYHGGRSDDLRAVLEWLMQNFPNTPITTVGFSLGANIVLKMGGESPVPKGCDSLIGVSPPLDLLTCVTLLSKPPNQILDQHFSLALVQEVQELHRHLSLPAPQFPKVLTVYDFDALYTAPLNGFKDAEDYYTQSSALQFIPNIDLPMFILSAKDDPLIFRHLYKKIPKKPNFDLLITPHGGHMGWLSPSHWVFAHCGFAHRWMDNAVIQWIRDFHERH